MELSKNIQTKIFNEQNKWPQYDDEIIDAISKVLKSGKLNYWTGNEVKQFEEGFAKYIGTKYAIAVFNGSVALELALYAIGIHDGDEVITTSRSFIASASSVILRRGTVIFADIDINTQNITLDTIKPCITEKTRAIIVVHLAGCPSNIDEIVNYAHKNNIYVIEDCAQAHGAKINNKYVGGIGDIGAWSFCQDKIITTGGEGGMITLNDEKLYKKAWAYKDHGKEYDLIKNPENNFKYKWIHTTIGTNWRMTEMQATIGYILYKRIDEYVKIRRRNAEILNNKFKYHSLIRIPIYPENTYHAYYKFYIFINENMLKKGWDRDRIIQEINKDEILSYVGSCSEIYLENAFKNHIQRTNRNINAQLIGQTSILFLVHPTLSIEDMNKIADKAIEIFNEACI